MSALQRETLRKPANFPRCESSLALCCWLAQALCASQPAGRSSEVFAIAIGSRNARPAQAEKAATAGEGGCMCDDCAKRDWFSARTTRKVRSGACSQATVSYRMQGLTGAAMTLDCKHCTALLLLLLFNFWLQQHFANQTSSALSNVGEIALLITVGRLTGCYKATNRTNCMQA